MLEFNFSAVCAPVFVPIDSNNNIDLNVIPKYSQYLLDNGIKSIFVNGGCGEFSSLTVSERKVLLERWIEVSNTDLQIVVNIGTSNFCDTVELGNHALQFNVYGLVIVPPYYMPVNNEVDLLSYLETIVFSLSRPSPLMYYHIPSLTKANIDLSTFVTLAKERDFRHLTAIKFTDSSSENLTNLLDTITCIDSGIQVLCGYEPLLGEALNVGVRGCILASVNITPRNVASLFGNVSPESKEKAVARIKDVFEEIAAFSTRYRIQVMGLLKMAAEACSGLTLGPMRKPYEIGEQHARLFKELLVAMKLKDDQ